MNELPPSSGPRDGGASNETSLTGTVRGWLRDFGVVKASRRRDQGN